MTPTQTKTAPAPTPGTKSAITVTSIQPETTGNQGLDIGVTSSGATGGATDIMVEATFNGVSIGQKSAHVGKNTWTCDIKGEFSPPGTLTITATDASGNIPDGTKHISV